MIYERGVNEKYDKSHVILSPSHFCFDGLDHNGSLFNYFFFFPFFLREAS